MDLTNRVKGHQIKYVASNGHILVLSLEDGSEVRVAWVDDNGKPIKGRPVVQGSGVRMRAEGIRDLIDMRTGRLAGVG